MAQNISKYVQLNDFLLLEYEFNRDGTTDSLTGMIPTVATTELGTKQYFCGDSNNAIGVFNNILPLNSLPTNDNRSTWFNNDTQPTSTDRYFPYFDSSTQAIDTEYSHDTIKIHVISGYNFDDVVGFMLQIRAEDNSSNMVDLSNFSYFKNDWTRGSDVVKFATTALYLGNRFYDKYIEFKVPSIYELGNDTTTVSIELGKLLDIKQASDVFVSYSTVPTIQGDALNDDNFYTLAEKVDVQLPVTSVADSFNALIAESTSGDYIEYYATWADTIIGQYMGDIESGRIPLYTSNNPNDNYEDFSDQYGSDTAKWVLIHELYVYEDIGGQSSLLTQKFAFTQEDNFSTPNYFRPVLKYADLDATYTIQYICRLSNRMDGTQIIRRASFASTDPKKYGTYFTRLNIENIIPYKVFNKLEGEQANIVEGSLIPTTKYVKTFYDTTSIIYNENNEIYPQGTGPLVLKNGDSVYKFKFEKINEITDQQENVDLSGAYNYALYFKLDDESILEAVPTYSTNMNTSIGELEFKLTGDQILTLLKQKNKVYSIIVKNPNGSQYTFYEGVYLSYASYNETTNYQEILAAKNKEIILLKADLSALTDANAALLATKQGVTETVVKPIASENPPSTVTVSPTVVVEQADKISTLEQEVLDLTADNIEKDNTIDEQTTTISKQSGIIRRSDITE